MTTVSIVTIKLEVTQIFLNTPKTDKVVTQRSHLSNLQLCAEKKFNGQP